MTDEGLKTLNAEVGEILYVDFRGGQLLKVTRVESNRIECGPIVFDRISGMCVSVMNQTVYASLASEADKQKVIDRIRRKRSGVSNEVRS